MKKRFLLLMLLMVLIAPWAVAQHTKTVHDGSSLVRGVPMYAYYFDEYTKSQHVIPASELSDMVGGTIQKIKYYYSTSSTSNTPLSTATESKVSVNLYITEVESTTISSLTDFSSATPAFSGKFTFATDGSIEITLTNQYEYNGGNLYIGIENPVAGGSGNYHNVYFVGESGTSGASTYNSSSSSASSITYSSSKTSDFLPKTTFTYVTTDPWISLTPDAATVFTGFTQELTATYGNVTGTPTITYSSSNSKVASVTGSGTSATVTGESVGTATITATMTYNASTYTATCDITVEEPSYCSPSFSNPSDDHITNFTTTGGSTNINNSSTYETGGYSDYYATISASIEAGETLSCTVTPSSTSYNYGHAIWVDWNKNYEFDDDEKVAYSTSAAIGNWTGEFEVPSTTAAGDYRLRVLHVYNGTNLTPCYSATYGEGEDYKLTVTAANPYQKPTALTIIDVDAHTATIGWTAPNSDVQSYKYQYKEEGGEWTALKSTTATSAPLTGLTAETHHIFQVQAIYAGNNESAFASIEFDTDIACPAPTNLAASDITAESANLSWDGSASSYNVRYRTQRGFHYDFEQATAWTYDNFPPCTTYDGDGVECYGFSSETFTNFPFTGSTFAFGSQSGNLSSHSGNVFGLMVCPVDASAADDWFILPAITIANGDVFQFYAREITDQYGDETINVGIYGDTPGTFAEVIDADVAIGETVYTLHSYDLSAYAGQTIRLAINYVSTDIFGFMFDDIFVGDPNDNTWDVTENKVTSPYPISGLTELTSYDFEVQADCGGGETSSWVATSFTTLPNCMPVSNLAVSDVTTTTVSLTWTDNNNGTASYIVTDGDDNPMTVTNLTVTGCTVTGLTANTLYTFKVSADCGSTTVSIQARTECNVITTIPYDESFETVTYYCWDLDGFTGLNNSTYAHTGNVSIYAEGSSTDPHQIILPETDADIDGLMLNFWYYNYNSGTDCGTLYVGYVTDPDDFTTFTEVGYIDMSSGISEYAQSQDFVFTGAPAGSRMAIDYDASGVTYAYVMIDDARIDIAPNCVKPYDLLVYDETAHGATFEWTANGSETEWHLYVSTENNAPADDINLKEVYVADSNPFTVASGLNPENTYYAWVRANCGGTDGYSAWVGPETFTTEPACFVPTGLTASEVTNHTAKLSWTGTSESYVLSVGTYDYTATPITGTILEEGFESTSMPEGWTHIGNGSAAPSTSYTHAGSSRSLEFTSATSNNVVVLPQFTAEPNQLTIDFWSRAESSTLSKSGYFDLGYVTNASDASTFVALETYSAEDHGSAYVHIENYSLSSVPDGARIAFRHRSGLTYYYWYIDDVTITGPTYPIAWDTYNTTDTQKTVEGLDPETQYFAKVKGNCGSEGYSQETAVISFTTDIPCPAPTGLTASNPTSTSFDLQWTNGGASDWVVAYKKTAETTFVNRDITSSDVTIDGDLITYTLDGLEAETEYTVMVQDNCEPSYAGDGQSEWTAEVNYSTIAACAAQNPVVDQASITHHTATVNWEGESTSGYTVKYRESALVSTENPVFYEAFNTNSSTPPTGWTRYSGLVDAVIAGSTSLTTVTTGWYTNSTHALGSYNAKLNIYGINVKHWLVTPEVVLTNGLSLSFDLALTDYNNGNVIEYPTQQPDDRFVVLVFADDAWHILREWNNSGSPYVYNTIATTGENVVLDLAAYAGKTIKVAFYGESTVSGASSGVDDNDLHIDNVLIGTTIPAGDWQTQAAATTTANLSGLTAGTKYDVKIVPNCDPTQESGIVNFTTLSSDKKYFLTAGNWETASNWMDGEIPTSSDDAVIRADVFIINNAAAKTVTLQGTPTPEITIAYGAQFVHNNDVYATLQKTIYGYGYASNPGGWNFIASPVNSFSTNDLPAGPYDLYKYDEPAASWYSNTGDHQFNTLTRGVGYLYANESDVTWNFTGSMIGTNTEVTQTLSFAYNHATDPDGVKGFNLMGNPYTRKLAYGDVTIGDEAMTAFLRLNNGDDYQPCNLYDGDVIMPGEGFFYQVSTTGKSMKFKKASAKDANEIGLISIVAGNDSKVDKAFVQIGGGNTLRKIAFSNSKSSVYVINNGDDYAAATIYELAGTMPVHFKAVAEGEYDITVDTKNLEASTLLLFDNFKNETIDLLETPTYHFKSSVDDQENRFKLIFDFNNNNYNGVEDNFTNGNFVYQSGDELIVNGEGELQIFDVLGRLVSSENISGVVRVSKPEKTGVYIFRLNEHTQKIVIK